MDIKKAIIPAAGLGTRFLPLSKIVSKELLPLVDIPLIQYIVKEAKESGIEEIIFVLNQNNKKIVDYFKPSPKIEKIVREKKREDLLEDIRQLNEITENLAINFVIQKNPLGDGHAILQAAKLAGSEPVACMFIDDIIESNKPAIAQLIKIFRTSQKPVIGLFQKSETEISHYGVVGVEKIAHKIFKIKKIIEKPEPGEAPSNLAISGRYIITPEVFEYLKKAKPGKNKEIILAEVFNNQMLKDGKLIYGYEIEGKWLECGDKLRWLKSNLYLSLKNEKYGAELKKYLKEIM